MHAASAIPQQPPTCPVPGSHAAAGMLHVQVVHRQRLRRACPPSTNNKMRSNTLHADRMYPMAFGPIMALLASTWACPASLQVLPACLQQRLRQQGIHCFQHLQLVLLHQLIRCLHAYPPCRCFMTYISATRPSTTAAVHLQAADHADCHRNACHSSTLAVMPYFMTWAWTCAWQAAMCMTSTAPDAMMDVCTLGRSTTVNNSFHRQHAQAGHQAPGSE
jgi:hypothetical protein